MPRKRPIRIAAELPVTVASVRTVTLEDFIASADVDLDEVPMAAMPCAFNDPEPTPLRTYREWVSDRTQRGGFDLLDSRLPNDRIRCEVELERRMFLAWEAAREGLA